MLEVSGLSAIYDAPGGMVHALDGVGFELRDGESLGIAGESACGKSTLGLSIMRMLHHGRVTSGDIRYRGESILDMDEAEFDRRMRWKEISMIFQGAMSSLDPVFTVREQFREALVQHGRGCTDTALEDSVRSVGLDASVLGRYPHELSGGMRQRVVIAMALVLKPALVIADEPTTALDVLVQAQIIDLLKRLRRGGTSFILITHDLAVLSEISDRIGIMYAGRMVEFGSSADIYGHPKHPYTQGLLESVPTLRGPRPGHIPGSPPSLLSGREQCGFLDRCPHATDRCRRDPPDFGTGSGHVRCWLYE